MNKRIIKNDILTLQPKSQTVHPITLSMIDNKLDKPLCLTKYQMVNSKIEMVQNYKCQNENVDIKSIMTLPPIGISANDILQIYDIYSIDSIKELLDNEEKNFFYINRLLNCFIRVNFDDLKNYNNSLENISLKILTMFFKKIINTIPNDKIKKTIKDYVDYWINKNNSSNFNIDFVNNMVEYLDKKYKK